MAGLFQVNAGALTTGREGTGEHDPQRAEPPRAAGTSVWRRRICPAIFLLLLGCAVAAGAAPAPEPEPEPAELEVSGYGIFGNRQLRRTLQILTPEGERPEFLTPRFIEDAVLILFSRLERDGFLRPRITTRLTLDDGGRASFVWTQAVQQPLPSLLRVKKADFRIKEGVRYHFDELSFKGLETVPEKRARSFFIETGGVLPLRRYRIFTPSRLRRGVDNLAEALQRQGYEQAEVTAEVVKRNDRTGNMAVEIQVKQGPKSIARSVREEIYFEDVPAPEQARIVTPNAPYSRLWSQDFAQSLRTNYYERGYPDTKVAVEVVRREPTNDLVYVDLLAKVQTGPRVKVGEVRFEGNERTKESVMKRRAPLKGGEWLDRMEAERGRLRLSRLGVFQSVRLSYEPAKDAEETRDVIYRVEEGRRIDVSLLFGYGSYEMLRAGVELEQFNLFGRAHHARLRLVQSLKSSRVNYTYTMPELLGEDLDVFFDSFFLRREEIDFTRLEYGGGAGVRRYFRSIDTEIDVRYDYQVLDASELEDEDLFLTDGVRNPGVGALTTNLRHDRRDNPLYPTKGYKLFGTFEFASEYLAGDVNFQRLELSGSYHLPLGESHRIHVGLAHGLVATAGSTEEDLPFNRRFFPGGENSIRGYQQGEAAPRNARGHLIGAETYSLGNLEFEQLLTPRWSVVGFFDALGFSRGLGGYPWSESLFSAGGGFRWKTVVGPVRLEYGHNLNPREDDPAGTLHFSLGFPF